jgi:hypothetical protein
MKSDKLQTPVFLKTSVFFYKKTKKHHLGGAACHSIGMHSVTNQLDPLQEPKWKGLAEATVKWFYSMIQSGLENIISILNGLIFFFLL